MPQIAKLYIRDDNDEPIGTIVLDMERVVEMYMQLMQQRFAEATQDNAHEQTDAAEGDLRMIRKIGENLAWYVTTDHEYILDTIPPKSGRVRKEE